MNTADQMLARIITAAIELGVIITLIRTGHLKPYLKKSEAYRLYGRRNINRWLRASLITARKDGGHSAAWRIDRIEVETLLKAIAIEDAIRDV
jgi:hypothetical protein